MALINDMYIHVVDEKVTGSIDVSSHPVETGIDITDHVKPKPYAMSISGFIVGKDAWSTLSTVRNLCKQGKIVKYSGRNIMANYIITSIDTGHPHEVWGGCSFDMSLQEVRIAKSPYTPDSAASQQVTKSEPSKTEQPKPKTHTVKNGDTLWSIAKSYYGDGSKYPKIVDVNKDLIKNPNVIQNGWQLVIP